MMRNTFIFLPLLALAACASNVQKLNELNPPANDFPTTLASEYQAYAESENEQGRHLAASHYADKGLKSLAGKTVEPEMPDTDLSPAQQTELANARVQLMKLLSDDDVKSINPQEAARAQLLFDCWQHQLSKDLNQQIAPCADEFHSTLQQLQEASDPLFYGREVHEVIDFASGSTQLDNATSKAIQDISQKLAHVQHYRVQLDAYSGIQSSQRKLTQARITAVHQELLKDGIAERRIRIIKSRSSKAVILGDDKITMDTKKVLITIKTERQKEPQE